MDLAEFKQIYSRMSEEFQNIQTESLKNEMKKELKSEFTEMLTAYDKDGDGKLSPEEQDKFLDDLQKVYAIDLPEEFKNQRVTDDDLTLDEQDEEQDDTENTEDSSAYAEDMSAYDDQPSTISTDLA